MYTFPLLGTSVDPPPNRCEICSATFADKDLLKGHLLIHLEERPLPWEMHQIGIISRVMAPPPPLEKPIPVQPPAIRDNTKKRTVGVVHQTDGFMCDVCGKHFTSLSGMTRHRQKHLDTGPPTDRKHRCTQCGYSTDNIANLVAHVRAHTGERPFRCEVCDKRFSRKTTLLSHSIVHSEERPFKCEVCGKCYKSERTLISHERKHAPFVCDVCGESFAFLRFLRSHEQRQHPKDSDKASEDVKCDGCGHSFPSASELQGHSCPLVGSFQCPHCPFSTDVRGSLNAHVRRMHVGERPRHPPMGNDLKCDVCSQVFPSLSELQGHQRKHRHLPQREGTFRCPHCPFASDTKGHLNAHVRRSHVGERRHECKVCGKAFFEANKLNRHLRTHSGKCVFVCSTCGLNFTDWAAWREHEKSHAGWEIFSCSACGRVFLKASDLRDHERDHLEGKVTAEPPNVTEDTAAGKKKSKSEKKKAKEKETEFKCVACSSLFSSSADLKRHQRRLGHAPANAAFKCQHCSFSTDKKPCLVSHERRMHNGERPHLCEVCGRAFFEACKLKRHLRLHSGERPFVCGTCGKGFVGGTELRRHERLHSGVLPYACGFCSKRFQLLYKLKNHEHKHRVLEPLLAEEEQARASKGRAAKRRKRYDDDEQEDSEGSEKEEEKREVKERAAKGRIRYIDEQENIEDAEKEDGEKGDSVKDKKGTPKAKATKAKGSNRKGKKSNKKEKKIAKDSFKCNACDAPFSSLPALVRHKRSHEKRKHRCRRCFYVTQHGPCLVAHLRTRHLHQCKLCDKTFVRKRHLDAHLPSHKTAKLPPKASKRNNTVEKGDEEAKQGGKKIDSSKSDNASRRKEKHDSKSDNDAGSKETDDSESGDASGCKETENLKSDDKTRNKGKDDSKSDDKTRNKETDDSRLDNKTRNKETDDSRLDNKTRNKETDDSKSDNKTGSKETDDSKSDDKTRNKETDLSKSVNKMGSKETEDFNCSGCGRGLASSSELQKHILEEHMIQELSESTDKEKETGKEASLCDERLASASEQLKRILEQQTTEADKDKEIGVFKCDTCDRIFSTLFSLKKHLKSHAKKRILEGGDQKYHCPLCPDYSTAFALSLKYHLRNHFGQTSTPAEKPTTRSSSSETTVVLKSPSEPRKKRHACGQCSYATDYASNLRVHLRKHQTDRPIPCPSCPKRFKDKVALRSHQRTHSAEKKFACDACGKRYRHASSLRNHECSPVEKPSEQEQSKAPNEVVKELEDIVLKDDCKCATCDKLLRALNEHRRTHHQPPPASPVPPKKRPPPKKRVTTKPRRLQCSHCDYSTLHRTNFKVHQKRHIKQKVFKCEVCLDLFTTQSAFTCHKKQHPELQSEFSHRCSECDFQTTSERKLATHVDRIHLGKRPHRCDQCKKCFFQLDELKRHQRFHTGERPFACGTCDKRFTIRGHLTIHERTHLNH